MFARLMILAVALLGASPVWGQTQALAIRPPSVPLVACDPYFSIWSPANELTGTETTHWTGRAHRLHSSISIDGKAWRIIGAEPAATPALEQTSVEVLPTRTIYKLRSPEVRLEVTFMTPSLPERIDWLSWPVTYVTYSARSADGRPHDVRITFEAFPEITVNDPKQEVVWSNPSIDGLSSIAAGSASQSVLARSGDDLRIEWGYLYVASPETQDVEWTGHELNLDLGKVSDSPVSRWLMLAYDDLFSIQYMGRNLRPYWRKDGWEASDLLQAAAAQYSDFARRCAAFDAELMGDLKAAGGEKYALLCALCFRQCFAAGKFVADANGQPLQFCKENHSNGCIATSDVFYPMAPQFLMFGPTLAKSFLVPFMNYAESDRWKFPFAPHDLGQYPLANGQVYGGGERTEENQMPVEESGNLLLLMAAVAQMDGKPDFANRYWPQLERWAHYLMEKGFDPENQLCTDDFAGHLAHNVNLSAKAICAIGAYSRLCAMRGDAQRAKAAEDMARVYAKRWVEEADDGDHFRLAFDKPGSWSQKYNLIWDKILGLNLFPPEVAEKELVYYRKIQNRFGLPLDNRKPYTKLDWITWTATLTQKPEDFEALIDPVIEFINATPDRSPLTDWYQTPDARKVGFTARPVVGGVFAHMLYRPDVWKKWASRDKTRASGWAALPKPPRVTDVIPVASSQPADWHFTTNRPADNWIQATFEPQGWSRGKSGFGTRDTPGTSVHSVWNTSDIWLIRDIELSADDLPGLHWMIHHDEDAEIFVNGKPAERLGGYSVRYELRPLSGEARRLLVAGKNRIAVHCRQTGGGQYIDVGLSRVEQPE